MKNDRMSGLIRKHAAKSRFSACVLLAVVTGPYLTLLAVEWVGRIAGPDQGLSVDAFEVGDLQRMAGVPWYDEQFCCARATFSVPDDLGSGKLVSATDAADVVVCGASFFTAGGRPAWVFGGQLARLSGMRVQNLAAAGVGPVQSVLDFVTSKVADDSTQQRVVLWGVVQRSLEGHLFRRIQQQLSVDGSVTRPARLWEIKRSLKVALRFNHRFEAALVRSSPVLGLVRGATPWLPPMALDRGLGAPVRMLHLEPKGTPMLFLEAGIRSYGRSYSDRGGDLIVDAVARVQARCRVIGARLIILLVPDKYEVYRDLIRDEGKDGSAHPPGGALQSISAALRSSGVEVVDLLDPLLAARLESGAAQVYYSNDSHWSPAGISVAAEIVAGLLMTEK